MRHHTWWITILDSMHVTLTGVSLTDSLLPCQSFSLSLSLFLSFFFIFSFFRLLHSAYLCGLLIGSLEPSGRNRSSRTLSAAFLGITSSSRRPYLSKVSSNCSTRCKAERVNWDSLLTILFCLEMEDSAENRLHLKYTLSWTVQIINLDCTMLISMM